jgi:hypothetical protein
MVAGLPNALENIALINRNDPKRALMKNLSLLTKIYILGTVLIGCGLTIWMLVKLDWLNAGLYILAALGAMAQTLKVEGPDDKTNYSIAWFVYGFTFIGFGPVSALFVVVISHLVEWIWHKYPWYIQSFNIGAHSIPVFLAGLIFTAISRDSRGFDLSLALGIAVANLVFVFGNHLLVGWVIKLARGRTFAESGVFGFFTLFLDFTLLSMGTVTALLWQYNPFASVLNMLPLYLLYHALRVPALNRQLQEMKAITAQVRPYASGD